MLNFLSEDWKNQQIVHHYHSFWKPFCFVLKINCGFFRKIILIFLILFLK
jgi:hypothetical protein